MTAAIAIAETWTAAIAIAGGKMDLVLEMGRGRLRETKL
jgi:hypothetical protein